MVLVIAIPYYSQLSSWTDLGILLAWRGWRGPREKRRDHVHPVVRATRRVHGDNRRAAEEIFMETSRDVLSLVWVGGTLFEAPQGCL